MTNGFRFDLSRCTGCQACQLACRIENGFDRARGWRQVYTFNDSRVPGLPLYHLSLACNHCGEAPCLRHCPALALRRDRRTGAVLLEHERCIGCSYCSWACPYAAPCYREEAGVMEKCTFCNERLLAGSTPACVIACPTAALGFGEIGPEEAAVPGGFPATEFRPSIRFTFSRAEGSGPELSDPAPAVVVPEPCGTASPQHRDSVGREWPLVVFTLAAALLVALSASSTLGGPRVPGPILAAAAFAAMGIGTVHLGRKERAWRAVRNLRGSWLSREIGLFGAFATGLLLQAAPAVGGWFWEWMSLATGFATLYAVDRVYDVALKLVPTQFHSAGVLLTGAFFTGLFLGHPVVLLLAGTAKLGLYLGRRYLRMRAGEGGWALVPALRVGLGLVLPAVLWRLPGTIEIAVALVVIGEAIDRSEYYLELDIQSPARELRREFLRLSEIVSTARARSPRSLAEPDC